MRPLLYAGLLALLAGRACAAEEAKPNTLTPKEVADGWLLLFDGETTFGWKVDGPAKVENGVFVLAEGGQAEPTTLFGDCEMAWEWRPALEREWRAKSERFFKFSAVQATHLRSLKVKPTGLQSIFNGKDLTAWKVFPNRKSEFTVNDRGELNIKNGPGDLQTEGQWANFVLQFDCISHGQHLNSGVFFRCRPNEYQQGYEAQIRNQFHEQPDQKYTLDLYDPKTNELKEKRQALYTAVDYGTGAIYRRQPARKGIAKDGEWFTMTVAADGRHFATWVNGIQVTDWTDNRPLKDNARNGCRLEKGPISLQGHDPTTNLSFRNFRIAELPTGRENK